MPSACVTHSASSPDAAWAEFAPTAVSPVSTTANELVKPTRAVTIPALIGWAAESGERTSLSGTDIGRDSARRVVQTIRGIRVGTVKHDDAPVMPTAAHFP